MTSSQISQLRAVVIYSVSGLPMIQEEAYRALPADVRQAAENIAEPYFHVPAHADMSVWGLHDDEGTDERDLMEAIGLLTR